MRDAVGNRATAMMANAHVVNDAQNSDPEPMGNCAQDTVGNRATAVMANARVANDAQT